MPENMPDAAERPAESDAASQGDDLGGPRSDAVEAALADAIGKAAAAGAWEAVTALTAELRARREARAHVVDLDAERRKRGGT